MQHDFVLKQRDRFSFELKLRHLLANDKARKGRYDADIYFFLPQAFHINDDTYPRDTFYDDLKLYLRFNTPVFTAAQLTDKESRISPLARLERMVADTRPHDSEKFDTRFDYEIRMLGCIYKSTLRDAVHDISQAVDRAASTTAGICGAVEQLEAVPARVHALRRKVTEELAEQHLSEQVELLDEHASLLLERYMLSLLYILGDRHGKARGDIEQLIHREMRYREAAGYPSVPTGDEGAHLEQYVYREKMLKRYASQALFLNAKTTDEAKRTQHLLYAVAAGIAMIFATGIAFYGQSVFGNLTSMFFVLLVASYMLKDRIKDFFRDVFSRSIGKSFYDRKTGLFDARRKHRLGIVKERAHFKTGAGIPAEVRTARDRGSFERRVTGDRGETVFVYNKRVKIYSRTLHRHHTRIEGLADISVVELRRFMQYLAVQYGVVPEVEPGGSISPKRVPRIYHLNMVLALRSEGGQSVHRFRIIANAKGIQRIEPVAADVTSIQTGRSAAYVGRGREVGAAT